MQLGRRQRVTQLAKTKPAVGVVPILPPCLGQAGLARAGWRVDKVDTDEADEVIVAIAKTVAELTSGQDGVIRQQLVEQLTHEIMNYDAEFRREDAAGAIGSHARH